MPLLDDVTIIDESHLVPSSREQLRVLRVASYRCQHCDSRHVICNERTTIVTADGVRCERHASTNGTQNLQG